LSISDSHDEDIKRDSNPINIGPNSGQYEEQYNANQDFAIFQPKDKTVGGIMSL